ncbi:type I polyketide synthase [Chitinophaga solisilvae]|uniref:type I polyketide synthase n=1 Tax=Chitinophaga solisilvae TaxID=1233460 RepID=UPI0013719F88|nr:type I polyketide synthase [Chitinophaga solisilvae]
MLYNSAHEDNLKNAVAVIGMSCRFPGGATSPEKYWEILKNNINVIHDIPNDRWNFDRYYDETGKIPGKIYTRHGGYLENIDLFDTGFFNITPLEAKAMDPQFRQLLELSYEAFENGNIKINELKDSATGVYTGILWDEYEDIANCDNSQLLTGNMRSSSCGRISYVYGLHGPSIATDTACSTSLTIISLACNDLLSGTCNLAVAGSVNLILSPGRYISLSELGVLAADGCCRSFDNDAKGFARSEGAGVVVLKRYGDALKDGDKILAVIAGTATNTAGGRSSYVTTDPVTQEKVIREALKKAGVSPDDIDYFEAHGTGTPVGDPIEMSGIASVFRSSTRTKNLLVGSSKTNIGHTESSAGMAGFIKAVLALQHNCIPANLHFKTPSKAIPWENMPVTIPVSNTDWLPGKRIRYACVNAFGLNGTNAHVVLRETPAVNMQEPAEKTSEQPYIILPVSAANDQALTILAGEYSTLLAQRKFAAYNIAAAAALRRSDLPCRLCVSGKDAVTIQQRLQEALAESLPSKPVIKWQHRKIAFVFPGQGGQWQGMGKSLLETSPVFRQSMIACDAAISAETGWSVIAEINKTGADNRLGEINILQPVLFAIEISLARLWESWGISPDVVIGHSMGEIAAACMAGILSLPDAVSVICRRSRLARKLSGQGAMALIESGMEDTMEILRPYEDKVSIAASNGPVSTVISGDPAVVDSILHQLEAKDIFCRRINADIASHSPLVDSLKEELEEQLTGILPGKADIPFYSTVVNSFIHGEACNASYWVNNLRKPVLFSQGIQQMLQQEEYIFIELGPHPTLLPVIQQNMEYLRKTNCTVIGSLKREQPEMEEMLEQLCLLYKAGGKVDWHSVYPLRTAEIAAIPLPRYPWQWERCWVDERKPGTIPYQATDSLHSFGSTRLHLASSDDKKIYWESDLSTSLFPFLNDHAINNVAVFPGTGYLEYVMSAATISYPDRQYVMEKIEYKQTLILDESATRVQLILTSSAEGNIEFSFYSKDKQHNTDWILLATGYLRLTTASFPVTNYPLKDLIQELDSYEHHAREECYAKFEKYGLQYGKNFSLLRDFYIKDDQAAGKIEVSRTLIKAGNRHIFHPAILDACLHTGCLLGISEDRTGGSILAAAFHKCTFFDDSTITPVLWVKATIIRLSKAIRGEYHIQISIYNDTGDKIVTIEDLCFKNMEVMQEKKPADFLYNLKWQPYHLPADADKPAHLPAGRWLVWSKDKDQHPEGLITQLIKTGREATLVNSEADLQDALTHDNGSPVRGIICLNRTPSVPVSNPAEYITADCMPLINLLRTLQQRISGTPLKLVIITSGTQAILQGERVELFNAPLWNLMHTAFHEFQEYDCTRFDLSLQATGIEWESVCRLLESATNDKAFAVRGENIYVSRLTHYSPDEKKHTATDIIQVPVAADCPYRFVTDTPGLLEGITPIVCMRSVPGEGEVEVRIAACGLNFMNVLSALGVYPGGKMSLGIEFAGEVTRVGPGVAGVRPGYRVMGITPAGDALGSFIVTRETFVIVIPDNLDYEDAATIPVAYGTAYRALVTNAGLKKGERVLIHNASGGVGLAAIHIANMIGAEIYATAGTAAKRQLLRDMGIQYVMDSRSTAFVQDTWNYTGNEGVDVILGAVTGELLVKSMTLLRCAGRYCDIGKKDIYGNTSLGMSVFKKGIAYSFLDLHVLYMEQPESIYQLHTEIMKGVLAGHLPPLPKTVFPASAVKDGFSLMAGGQHTGKIVFNMTPSGFSVVPLLFNAHETYIITGGMGGLGITIARWMSQNGAAHIVLTGRNDPGQAAANIIADMRAAGCELEIIKGDISDFNAVKNMLEEVRGKFPPIKGIFHAALVLDDGTLMTMDESQFNRPLLAKTNGAWLLHQLTQQDELQYFVLFSSAASFLGLPGQGNYVAANAFLDALSKYRQAAGLPVTCINWGTVADVGLAAAKDIRGARLHEEGIGSFTVDSFLEIFSYILKNSLTDVMSIKFNPYKFISCNPSYLRDNLFKELLDEKKVNTGNTSAWKTALLNYESAAVAEEKMEQLLQGLLGSITRMTPSRIMTDTPFGDMGIDSLMITQLRNKIESSMGLSIPLIVINKNPRIKFLAHYILQESGIISA